MLLFGKNADLTVIQLQIGLEIALFSLEYFKCIALIKILLCCIIGGWGPQLCINKYFCNIYWYIIKNETCVRTHTLE